MSSSTAARAHGSSIGNSERERERREAAAAAAAAGSSSRPRKSAALAAANINAVNSNAAAFAHNSQPQLAHDVAFRGSERSDAAGRLFREASPGQSPYYAASTSHKRTASGNPRPSSRMATGSAGGLGGGGASTADGASSRAARAGTPTGGGGGSSSSSNMHNMHNIAEERRTERTVITSRETYVTRTRSPDRRPPSRTTAGSKTTTTTAAAAAMAAPAASASGAAGGGSTTAVGATWRPEVTLQPHTTAPLASRVAIPRLAAHMPASLQPAPLSSLSLEAQEAAVLEDLLCVFMGCEGQYIRFGKAYDPAEERDRLAGPPWRILPGLDPSLQDLTASMLRTATHYVALEAFVDVQSREQYGLVSHALCAAVRRFLQDYLVLIAQLETQFLTDDAFTLHVLNIHMLPTSQMMLQLYALAHELLQKNGLVDGGSGGSRRGEGDGGGGTGLDDSGGSDDDDDDDDDADDYDKIIDRLREGGELVPGHAASRRICKGGAVLELITRRLEAMAGDPAARALLTALLRDASRPYMGMLNEWLHHGGISDPHAEFLVKEQKSIRRELLKVDYTDEYWDRRYTLRDKDVPPQLAGVKDKVLLAGKYLNVVRECGGIDVSQQVMDVPTSFDDPRFLDNINTAYAHANASLMRLLLTTHALPARLRSLKHYFFLDPSDSFSYFLELGHSELRKRNIKAVNTSKLQSLLDLVLRQPGSAVALDPFKEDVKVEMNTTTLVQALQRVVNITGIEPGEVPHAPSVFGDGSSTAGSSSHAAAGGEADGYASLQLDYTMPFPVSLVISRKTIWRYQALFRFLLSLHHLEAQLSTTWQNHMRELPWFHRSASPAVAAWKRRLFTLRARMLVFVQQLLYFCTAEVIEPNWQALMSRLQTQEATTAVPTDEDGGGGAGAGGGSSAAADPVPSRTVDELMQDHVDFLDTCLKECMLTNSKLLKTCFSFVSFASYLTRNMDRVDPDLAAAAPQPKDATAAQWKAFHHGREGPGGPGGPGGAASSADPSAAAPSDDEIRALVERLAKYEHLFGRNLQVLLDALNHYAATETVVLLSLCARLSTANQGTEYAGLRHEEDLA